MGTRNQGKHVKFPVVDVMRRDYWCPHVDEMIANPVLDKLAMRIRSEI